MQYQTNTGENYYRLALSFVKGIGAKRAAALLNRYGTAEAIFKAPLKEAASVEGMHESVARELRNHEVFRRAEAELSFTQKHGIKILFIQDEEYPQRFLTCADPPLLLYYRGDANLNATKVAAVIGTRSNTEYGQRLTEDLIDGLNAQDGLIITSGLAYGIDAIAHRRSIKAGIPTVGVMGNSMERIYPAAHKSLAAEMLTGGGGLLTEFPSGTAPDRNNFPVRNRIVAGISDVTVIVESPEKGGSMITAYMAAGYNREVAAFPGRVHDTKSGGPNKLIRLNIAAMIHSAEDLLALMNWDIAKKKVQKQPQLFLNLSPEEQKIIEILQSKDAVHADELMLAMALTAGQLSAILLNMEMQGLVKTLPGKRYRTN